MGQRRFRMLNRPTTTVAVGSVTHQTLTSVAGILTIDLSLGGSAQCTLTENITQIAITNPPAAGVLGTLRLILIQHASSAKTVTWTTKFLFPSDTAPVMTTAVGDSDIIELTTTDNGVIWYGVGATQAYDTGAASSNNSPVWDSQPQIRFVFGTASSYDMDDISSDADSDPLTATMNTGTVALPTGVTWNAGTKVLSYDGTSPVVTTNGHIITLDDGEDTTPSNSFDIRVTSGDGFPRLAAGRIGDRDWGTGGSFVVDPGEQNAMVQCHFSIVQPQHIHLDSNRLAAFADWLNYIDANEIGTHFTYMYTDMTETADDGSAEALKLDAESGPGGVGDWWVYEDATAGTESTKFGTFGGSLHTNLSDLVTPDSDGKIWPEWYADNSVQNKLDLVQTQGNDPRVHVYNDVSDHRVRSPGQHDYNADGSNDNGYHGWEDGSFGQEAADHWREGHRTYFDRVRTNNHANMSVVCNFTTWGQEYSGTDINQMLMEAGTQGRFKSYFEAVDGGWMEHLTTGPALSGMSITNGGTGTRVVELFGSWRLAQNQVNYLVEVSTGNRHVLAHWASYMSGGGDDNDPRVGGNMTSAMMAQARWGICSTLMTDAYCFIDNNRTPHNMTMLFDEYGVVNTGTTGLSREWLGQPIDDSQLVKELASSASSVWKGVDDNGIFKREFDNGIVLVNSKLSLSGSITIVVKSGADESNGELESGRWKFITGLQDSAVNTGATITSDITINSADGRVLERV